MTTTKPPLTVPLKDRRRPAGGSAVATATEEATASVTKRKTKNSAGIKQANKAVSNAAAVAYVSRELTPEQLTSDIMEARREVEAKVGNVQVKGKDMAKSIDQTFKELRSELNNPHDTAPVAAMKKVLGKIPLFGLKDKFDPMTVSEALENAFNLSARALTDQKVAADNLVGEVQSAYTTIDELIQEEAAAAQDYESTALALLDLQAAEEQLNAELADEPEISVRRTELRAAIFDIDEQQNEKARKLEEFKFAKESLGLALDKIAEFIQVMEEEVSIQGQVISTARLKLQELAREIPLVKAAQTAQEYADDVRLLTERTTGMVNDTMISIAANVANGRAKLQATREALLASDMKVKEAAEAVNKLVELENEEIVRKAVAEAKGHIEPTDDQLQNKAQQDLLAAKSTGSKTENDMTRRLDKIDEFKGLDK